MSRLPRPNRTRSRSLLATVAILPCVLAPSAPSLCGAEEGGMAAVYQSKTLADVPSTDPQDQLESFIVGEGLEVILFASEPMVVKPNHMNWDARGRLWTTSSDMYPHIEPGQKARDRILVLEDTDRDGVADKSTVFAEGLLIPTGVLPGDGGVYVANSTELLHLEDTDGDGEADKKRTVLSGFGTEDTHHILHTLRWGPDGWMYFNQSIYIHSHIETPHGPRRLGGSGIWRFRPEDQRLEVFMRGLVNPWGHVFDRWGQSFATDGAGGEGINYTFPGAVFCTAPGAERILQGLNPGSPKHCGLEIATGGHLPEEWTGDLLTNDFRARRVCRFELSEDGAGYSSQEREEILRTDFTSFRPIDTKIGPDGAIYIADWYNPIIQHGEVDFRDPRRDHEHGRIWRVTVKGRPLLDPPDLVGVSIPTLLELLKGDEQRLRLQAKLLLKRKGRERVVPLLRGWLDGLDPEEEEFEHHRLEALWTFQGLSAPEPELLELLLDSKDPRVRAAAVRVLSDWATELESPLDLLAERIVDEHPRVRLEALRALGGFPNARAADLALTVRALPMDRFLDHALFLTIRELEPYWLQRAEVGEPVFGGNLDDLLFALETIGSQSAVGPLVKLLAAGGSDVEREQSLLDSIARLGGEEELSLLLDLALDPEKSDEAKRDRLLATLVEAARKRKVIPNREPGRVVKLLSSVNEEPLLTAIRASGFWKLDDAVEPIARLATAEATPPKPRGHAIQALGRIGGDLATKELLALVDSEDPLNWRTRAAIALAEIDVATASRTAATLLAAFGAEEDPATLLRAFLRRDQGPTNLATALTGIELEADIAKKAIRVLDSSGQSAPELVAALVRAGGLGKTRTEIAEEEMASLLASVKEKGNPERGEEIFRSEKLQCAMCHAIAGAGGKVGPDLSTVGASAQVDYLIESLLLPNKAIKEGFHSLVVNTIYGEVFSGIKIRETGTDLLLRDRDDAVLSIPLDEIEDVTDGLSLMPSGLVDLLPKQELTDLIRFLSQLGKTGVYAPTPRRFVRTWRALLRGGEAAEDLRVVGPEAVTGAAPGTLEWGTFLSKVSGELPLAPTPAIVRQWRGRPYTFLQFDIRVSVAGEIGLRFDSAEGIQIWLESGKVEAKETTAIDVPKGELTITLAVDRSLRDNALVCELVDLPGSEARAQIKTGD